jgi:hypothetical protein
MKLDPKRKGIVWGCLLTMEQQEIKRLVGDDKCWYYKHNWRLGRPGYKNGTAYWPTEAQISKGALPEQQGHCTHGYMGGCSICDAEKEPDNPINWAVSFDTCSSGGDKLAVTIAEQHHGYSQIKHCFIGNDESDVIAKMATELDRVTKKAQELGQKWEMSVKAHARTAQANLDLGNEIDRLKEVIKKDKDLRDMSDDGMAKHERVMALFFRMLPAHYKVTYDWLMNADALNIIAPEDI